MSEIVNDFEEYLVKKYPRTKVLAVNVSTTTGAALPQKKLHQWRILMVCR